MNKSVERRIRFLLDAAKNEVKRDQVVTYAMRVLSNYAAIGKDAGSIEIKKQNKRVSHSAQTLLHKHGLVFFCKNTINEHPKPLKIIWQWLQDNADKLTVKEVWHEFANNPMVTITKDEDKMIKARGLNSAGNLQTRYTELGIEVVILSETPNDYHTNSK